MPSLTTSGTPTANGDSTVTINSTGSDRVQAPASLVDETQGWFAIRTVCIATQTNGRRFFSWRPDGNNFIEIYHGSTAQSGQMRTARFSGGSGSADAIGANWTAGDHTIIGKWTSTQIGMSTDGGAFALVSNTTIPDLSATTEFDLGRLGSSALSWLESSLYWCAAGTGTLSDADAATIHAFDNSDPAWGDFPAGATLTFLWKCNDFTYEDSVPVGTVQQSMLLLGLG